MGRFAPPHKGAGADGGAGDFRAAFGLTQLLSLLALRSGKAGFTELATALSWRSLIPGLRGTFSVFANLLGYQRLGAGTTISVLVTSQLIGGLIADAIRTGSAKIDAATLVGAVMPEVGTVLLTTKTLRDFLRIKQEASIESQSVEPSAFDKRVQLRARTSIISGLLSGHHFSRSRSRAEKPVTSYSSNRGSKRLQARQNARLRRTSCFLKSR